MRWVGISRLVLAVVLAAAPAFVGCDDPAREAGTISVGERTRSEAPVVKPNKGRIPRDAQARSSGRIER